MDISSHSTEPATVQSITLLPRVHETEDFSKLACSKCPECEVSKAISVSGSEASSSTSSQILYMKSSKEVRRNALSTTSNGSGKFGQQWIMDEDLSAAEEIAWSIVDQEIFEWQYVCQTGRPYWWSPESKIARLKNLQPQIFSEASSRIWMRDIVDECWKSTYRRQNRTLSEDIIQDSSASHNLAHRVAIQLLGSCFTLPPDHITGAPSPNYSMWDGKRLTLPDPRMISSLRMHSHFRYSPSFGHQARNVSPMAMGMGTFDGTSPSLTHLAAHPSNVSIFLPTKTRRRRIRRRVARGDSSDNVSEGAAQVYTHPISSVAQQPESFRAVPREEIEGDYRPKNLATQHSSQDDLDQSTHEPRSEYRLQSVLRSESHHVFVQPVKELVVKRWKTFRKRLGGSSPGRRLRSDEESESGQSARSITGPSTGGRERRRRAQNDSEIGGSMDSDVHLNSPASQQATPPLPESGESRFADVEGSHFQYHLADSPTAAAELVAALSDDPYQTHWSPLSGEDCKPLSHTSTNPELQDGSNVTTTTTTENVPQKPECQTSFLAKQTVSCAAHSYSSRRSQVGRRRKSLLSEVRTPDDFNQNGEATIDERGVLNGGQLPSSAEVVEPLSPIRQQRHWLCTPASVESKSTMVEQPSSEQLRGCATQMSAPDQNKGKVDSLPVGSTEDG